jgi:hypothetical protein
MSKVFYANGPLRTMLFLVFAGLGSLGLLGAFAGLASGKLGGDIFVVIALAALWAIVFLWTAVNALSHNRIELAEGVVKTPPFVFFPFNLLGTGEIQTGRIVRWGVGEGPVGYGLAGLIARLFVGPEVMLVDVKDDHGSVSTHRIVLGTYSTEDARQITEYFQESRLRKEPVLLSFLWGLQFAS